MIWFQSAAGAALAVGWLWAILSGRALLILGLPVCGILWLLALRPLAIRASRLDSERRLPAAEMPTLLLVAWGFGELLSVADMKHFVLLTVTNLVVLITVVIRRVISVQLDVPFHVETWIAMVGLTGFGFVVRILLLLPIFSHC